jgi:flagellar basal-body rod protein FlgB
MGSGPLANGIADSMRHLSQRQQVIAQNIANADTPGYKAREVAAPDFGALLETTGQVRRPTVRISSAMAALGAKGPSNGGTILDRGTSETKPDGNNVTLEDQLMKVGQIQADFATMSKLYAKQMGMFQKALGNKA